MGKFKHLKEISSYNRNYYIGFNNNLLYGKSDDDDTTEWWLLNGEDSHYLGESYCSDGKKLCRYETRCT